MIKKDTSPDMSFKVSTSGLTPKTLYRVTHRVFEGMENLIPCFYPQTVGLADYFQPGCVVLATEDDLHQILYNLMENGIKYSGHMGFVHTALTVEGGDVVIRVEDNGVGISDEDMPHIFERFYRVDKARSRQAGGSGLGLSIVHDMVLRNDSTISVAPRPEGGTCFTVVFPAFDIEEEI